MGILQTVKSLISRPVTGGEVTRPRAQGSYMRGGRGVTFQNWRPPMREAHDDISEAWDLSAARVADMVHNSGWLAGMIEQAVANTVGPGLRLKALPENETFGMSAEEASKWAKDVERRFELWARNPLECDVQGMRTFGQMQGAAFLSWIGTGEILAELPWRPRPYANYGTKVRLLPPTRLSRSSNSVERIVNGVRINADGMPIAYLAVKIDQMGFRYEVQVRARDRLGRPKIIHVFDGRPGTFRGISPLTPVLQVAKQFDQLADATLMSSIVQTLFAATIEGDEPTEEVLEGLLTPDERANLTRDGVSPIEAYLATSQGFYDAGSPINLGMNGRLGFLFPGQELKFHTSQHSSENYKEFANFLLREIARCLGMTYESATGDNIGATYSSLQASTTEVFAVTKMRRENIVARFCQPAYEAWLEESIEKGETPFPGGIEGFQMHRTAACRADWRGSPRPRADDLKTAKAHEIWARMGVMSDAMICNELGTDVDDVYQQRAQEMAMRKDEYKLPEPQLMGAGGGAPDQIEGEGGDDGAAD